MVRPKRTSTVAEAGQAAWTYHRSQISIPGRNTSLLSQDPAYVSDFEGRFNSPWGRRWQKTGQNDRNHTIITNGTTALHYPLDPPGPVSHHGRILSDGLSARRFQPGRMPVLTTIPARDYQQVFDARQVTTVSRETDHRSVPVIDFDLTETLVVRAEARWTDETTDVTAPNTYNAAARRAEGTGSLQACGSSGNCIPGVSYGAYPPNGFGTPGNFSTPLSFSRSDSYVTPKVGLQWNQSNDTMWYFSWAVAKKPGGFSTLGFGGFGADANGNGEPDEIEFDPEEMQVWEVGMKRTLMDGRLRFNGAYFYQDFTDKQISAQRIIRGQLGTVISNASGAEVHGLELDANWLISDNWRLSAGYTWLKGEFTDYKVLSTGSADAARVGNCNLVMAAGEPICEVDRSGYDLERTPNHAWQFTLAYQGPSRIRQGWDNFASFSAHYQGERFIEDYNKKILQSYWLANLNFGLATDEWNYRLCAQRIPTDDTVRWAGAARAMPGRDWRLGVALTPQFGPPTLDFIPSPRIATARCMATCRLRARSACRLNYRF